MRNNLQGKFAWCLTAIRVHHAVHDGSLSNQVTMQRLLVDLKGVKFKSSKYFTWASSLLLSTNALSGLNEYVSYSNRVLTFLREIVRDTPIDSSKVTRYFSDVSHWHLVVEFRCTAGF